MKANLRRYKGLVAIPLVFGIGGAVLGGAIAGTIGASIGFMAGSMIGSYLFPTKSSAGTMNIPKIGNYPLQTSSKGGAVPVICGTQKVASNIIWLGDLHPYQHRVS